MLAALAAATASVTAMADASSLGRGQARLETRLSRALSGSGTDVGVLVYDLNTGRALFARDPGVRRMPASLEKLYTSVAMLQMYGPKMRLRTEVLGTGHLGRHGVWHGNLYLRGDGDPTLGDGWWNRVDDGGDGPTLSQLVAQLHRRGIRRVTGKLWADESLFDADRGGPLTDDMADTPDYGGELSALVFDHGASARGYTPATFAARELVITMREAGITARISHRGGVTPRRARVLASAASPPLETMLTRMDTYSDDLFADLFAKQLGHHFFGGVGSLATGSIEIRQDLATSFSLRPLIFDGSGLDKADRSSPRDIVTLLRDIEPTPIGADLRAAMAVVGRSGTVQGMGVGTYAVGHCQAKTGTLNYVTNLAGYCTARGGHTLAFAVLIDGPSNADSIPVLGRVVGAIAAY